VDQAVVFGMVQTGWSLDQIVDCFERHPIGAKYRERHSRGRRYLESAVANAQSFEPAERGKVRGARIVRCFPDVVTSSGGPGLRLRMIFEFIDGTEKGRRFRDGVSMPDAFRKTNERWQAFWTATGAPPPLIASLVRRLASQLEGRQISIQAVRRSGTWRVARFCPLVEASTQETVR